MKAISLTYNTSHLLPIFIMTGVLILCFVGSCRRGFDSSLVEADSKMEAHPDSALMLLEDYKFASNSSSADSAYYALLLTHARYKKSISAFYYDMRGNVTESRERTYFGALRTAVNTYTYSGQPLKSTVTEGSVTTVTDNTYDTATGLLTATDVTVNGTKQRVSAVTYDDLGRIASVVRGAEQGSGGKVSYTYNLHGQTKTITGPGFSQNLYYADWTGTKLYNGSVSAMTWKMGSDETVRGYSYTYNGYGWLTSADYGEGTSLSSNKNRYTEKFTSFTLNGGVVMMQRNGLRADGNYGNVDNLLITYNGNRMRRVIDKAGVATQNGSMDFPGSFISKAFTYNEFGALSSDAARGITSIEYDDSGNPVQVDFSNDGSIQNVYTAMGDKIESILITPVNVVVGYNPQMARTVLQYRGPFIYRNNKVDMVLFPGGYATVSGTAVTFHYYTQDYLGNNRAVINGSTGAIEQTVAYYPYGAVIADLGTPTSGQPYKFGGKELITSNGLNEYDFGARQYYSAVPAFTKPDPMAEKYPWLSPYLYCANNPVNLVDPTGKVIALPKGSTLDQINSVMYNMQLLTDDKLVYKTLDDGTIRIKIASTGKGSHSNGTRLVRRLNSSKKTVTINVVNDKDNGTIDKNKGDAINMKGSDAEIRFNPDSNPDIPLVNKKNGKVNYGKRPSYMGLSHEMIHADRTMRGVAYDYNLKTPYRFIDENGNPIVESIRMEEAATIGLNYNELSDITENDIRKEHGLPLRGAYGN